MDVRLSLFLPRDAASVPMARQILATTLRTVGVTEDCRADILLALAEACANAVVHAAPADTYEVTINLDESRCLIEVLDSGAGFDFGALPAGAGATPSGPPVFGEAGRGLHIIRALADQLDVRPNEPHGTLLRFVKRLD